MVEGGLEGSAFPRVESNSAACCCPSGALQMDAGSGSRMWVQAQEWGSSGMRVQGQEWGFRVKKKISIGEAGAVGWSSSGGKFTWESSPARTFPAIAPRIGPPAPSPPPLDTGRGLRTELEEGLLDLLEIPGGGDGGGDQGEHGCGSGRGKGMCTGAHLIEHLYARIKGTLCRRNGLGGGGGVGKGRRPGWA